MLKNNDLWTFCKTGILLLWFRISCELSQRTGCKKKTSQIWIQGDMINRTLGSKTHEETRSKLFKTMVVPILAYSTETLALAKQDRSKIQAVEMHFLRRAQRIYKTVISALLRIWNCETWVFTKANRKHVNTFERKILGLVHEGARWRVWYNNELYDIFDGPDVSTIINLPNAHVTE